MADEPALRVFNAAVDAAGAAGLDSLPDADRARVADMLTAFFSKTEETACEGGACDVSSLESRVWRNLQQLRTQLKALVPFGSINERVVPPPTSSKFDASVPYYDLDAFLYDDEDVDAMVEEGLVQRHYCSKCGATDTIRTTEFISHSFNAKQLLFLGTKLLPMAIADPAVSKSFTVVDVGSRLGIVPAVAAHVLPRVCRPRGLGWKVTGIEVNQQLVDVQRRLFEQQRLKSDTCEVVALDALSVPGQVHMRSADFVVMHNVFEWFLDTDAQLDAWTTVRSTICRTGQHILVVPSLEETLEPLFAHADSQRNEKRSRKEQSPKARARAFYAEWVEPVDTGAAIADFMAAEGHGDDSGDDAASQGDAEFLEGLLRDMHVYRVR